MDSPQSVITRISVREFVAPLTRHGDIQQGVGGLALVRGQEIHQRVQARHQKRDKNYQSEFSLKRCFVHKDCHIEVGGRVDGAWIGDAVRIEEIKSTTSIPRLLAELDGHQHPYVLQLQTYVYLYSLEHGVVPDCHLLLVSSYDESEKQFTVPFDLAQFESWFIQRLDAWRDKLQLEQERAQERARMADEVVFPFDTYRRGQKELVDTVADVASKQGHLLIQAPTGMGKTMATLVPLLRDALANNRRVIYVTPKNSQHRIALDAANHIRATGCDLRVATIRSKEKSCFKDEVICDPGFCEFARGYYDKCSAVDIVKQVIQDRVLTSERYDELGRRHELCPYELSLDLLSHVDLVICDYNYLISPSGTAFTEDHRNIRDHVIIDEAHNLADRAREQLSSSLCVDQLLELRDQLKSDPRSSTVLNRLCSWFREMSDQVGANIREIDIDHSLIGSCTGESGRAVADLLSRGAEQWNPHHATIQLYRILVDLSSALTRKESMDVILFDGRTTPTLKVMCLDPGRYLKQRFRKFSAIIAMSATLKPFEFYGDILGMEQKKMMAREFSSVFPVANRKIMIVPQVNSLYRERQQQAPRIAELIERVIAVQMGNYFVFFPSFAFLDQVADLCKAPGFKILKQRQGMDQVSIQRLCARLKKKRKNHIVFAVQGGSLAEGLDFPGDQVSGAFVIGPGLPAFTAEREKLRQYFDKKGKDGFAFAYIYPGMARAVQAAGRVIRTETDRGILICADRRFLDAKYAEVMPADWYDKSVNECVSRSILDDLKDFWSNPDKEVISVGLVVLGIPNCDRVRAARKWLNQNLVKAAFRDIRKQPLTETEWTDLLEQDQAGLLINRRGPVFRKLGLTDEILDSKAWAALLMEHPTLMKRPVLVEGGDLKEIGFKGDQYAWLLAAP